MKPVYMMTSSDAMFGFDVSTGTRELLEGPSLRMKRDSKHPRAIKTEMYECENGEWLHRSHALYLMLSYYPKFICGFVDHGNKDLQNWRKV